MKPLYRVLYENTRSENDYGRRGVWAVTYTKTQADNMCESCKAWVLQYWGNRPGRLFKVWVEIIQ